MAIVKTIMQIREWLSLCFVLSIQHRQIRFSFLLPHAPRVLPEVKAEALMATRCCPGEEVVSILPLALGRCPLGMQLANLCVTGGPVWGCLTQGLNLGLPYCKQILYCRSHQENLTPVTLGWYKDVTHFEFELILYYKSGHVYIVSCLYPGVPHSDSKL